MGDPGLKPQGYEVVDTNGDVYPSFPYSWTWITRIRISDAALFLLASSVLLARIPLTLNLAKV